MYLLEQMLLQKHLMKIGNLKLSSLVHVDGMMRERGNFDIDEYVIRDMSRRFAEGLVEYKRIQPRRDREREGIDNMFGMYPTEQHLAELYCLTPEEMFQLLRDFGEELIWGAKRHYDREFREQKMLEEMFEKDRLMMKKRKRAQRMRGYR